MSNKLLSNISWAASSWLSEKVESVRQTREMRRFLIMKKLVIVGKSPNLGEMSQWQHQSVTQSDRQVDTQVRPKSDDKKCLNFLQGFKVSVGLFLLFDEISRLYYCNINQSKHHHKTGREKKVLRRWQRAMREREWRELGKNILTWIGPNNQTSHWDQLSLNGKLSLCSFSSLSFSTISSLFVSSFTGSLSPLFNPFHTKHISLIAANAVCKLIFHVMIYP